MIESVGPGNAISSMGEKAVSWSVAAKINDEKEKFIFFPDDDEYLMMIHDEVGCGVDDIRKVVLPVNDKPLFRGMSDGMFVPIVGDVQNPVSTTSDDCSDALERPSAKASSEVDNVPQRQATVNHDVIN